MNQEINQRLERLNPCPTCGKKDEIQTGQRSPGRFFIECYRCHVSVSDDRLEKVQAHWNAIGRALNKRIKMLVADKNRLRDMVNQMGNALDNFMK